MNLLYAPREKTVRAFANAGLQGYYPDKVSEIEKQHLVHEFERSVSDDLKQRAADQLRELLGIVTILTYSDRVRAALGALPQEIRFIAHHDSTARVFESIGDASTFLENPDFDFAAPVGSYVYQITYSDGSEFERVVQTLDELRALHVQTDRLASHMRGISK